MASDRWPPAAAGIAGAPGATGPTGAAGANAAPAASTLGVDAKATAVTSLLAAQAAKFLLPRAVYVRVKTLTGALVTPPIIRVGNNGTHDNVCALLTLTGAVVGQIFSVPLLAVPLAVDIGTTAVSVEVQTGAVVTTMTLDVYLDGVIV